jgi:predicted dinucleotide-binding enzyme
MAGNFIFVMLKKLFMKKYFSLFLFLFLCGYNAGAKEKMKEIFKAFGRKSPVDLGNISASRGLEMILPVWLRLWSTFNH